MGWQAIDMYELSLIKMFAFINTKIFIVQGTMLDIMEDERMNKLRYYIH